MLVFIFLPQLTAEALGCRRTYCAVVYKILMTGEWASAVTLPSAFCLKVICRWKMDFIPLTDPAWVVYWVLLPSTHITHSFYLVFCTCWWARSVSQQYPDYVQVSQTLFCNTRGLLNHFRLTSQHAVIWFVTFQLGSMLHSVWHLKKQATRKHHMVHPAACKSYLKNIYIAGAFSHLLWQYSGEWGRKWVGERHGGGWGKKLGPESISGVTVQCHLSHKQSPKVTFTKVLWRQILYVVCPSRHVPLSGSHLKEDIMMLCDWMQYHSTDSRGTNAQHQRSPNHPLAVSLFCIWPGPLTALGEPGRKSSEKSPLNRTYNVKWTKFCPHFSRPRARLETTDPLTAPVHMAQAFWLLPMWTNRLSPSSFTSIPSPHQHHGEPWHFNSYY